MSSSSSSSLSSASSRRRGAIVATTTNRTIATNANADRNDNDDGQLRFDTLHELVTNATSTYGSNPLFGTFVPPVAASPSDAKETARTTTARTSGDGGSFEWTTYASFGREVSLARCVLRDMLGMVPHTKIGIVSNNRREWAIIASAAYSLNCAVVPMYENQRCEDWSHVLNDSGCIALVCSTNDVYSRARREALADVPRISREDVLCLDASEEEPHSFRGAMARAERDLPLLLDGDGGGNATPATTTTNDVPEDLGIVAPSPDDLANLIYTSGTTGRPKGVELVHSNQVSNIKGCRDMSANVSDFPTSNDRSLAFLPWAHSYGQVSKGIAPWEL